MNLWLAPQTRPRVIGHRGASAHAPENTLGAMQLAIEQGADGIEFDVKLAQTGEVVVMHDTTVDRTTNGQGAVHALSLAQLRTLDAGAGERVPLLDEVFELIRTKPGFLINIELTNYATRGDGLDKQVVACVRRHADLADRVLCSSFDHIQIRRLATLMPDVPRGLLYSPDDPLPMRQVWLSPIIKHEFRHPQHSMVSLEFVRRMRAAGRGVNAWTINAPEDIRRMIAAGVSGLIGDSPATLRAHVAGA